MNNSKAVAIKVDNLSKVFKLPHEKHSSIKSMLVRLGRGRGYEMQQVLKNVSFDIKEGEFFGIVGRNGSGKSTLLKLLAGIYMPTGGNIQVNGNLTPFIELGVGFNAELTGRENVFLNGALLGFSRSEMDKLYDDIVEFAELGKFMDQKLKNYSSGMQVRLAFSIAIRAQTDILLIDEVLAVGDASFQQKCYNYFRKLKIDKKTVVFVSHDRSAIENFCDRCLLVDEGKALALGKTSKVLSKYNEITLDQMADTTPSSTHKSKNRWGTKDIQINSARFIGDHANRYLPNETIKLQIDMLVRKSTTNPVFGLVIKRPDGTFVLTTNTKAEKIVTGKLKAGSIISAIYEIENIFGNGEYRVSPAVSNEDTTVFYDWREGFAKFFVSGWDDTYSNIHPPHSIKLETVNA